MDSTVEKTLSSIQEDYRSIKRKIESSKQKLESVAVDVRKEFRKTFKKFKMNVKPDEAFIKKTLRKIRKKDGKRYKVRLARGPKELVKELEKFEVSHFYIPSYWHRKSSFSCFDESHQSAHYHLTRFPRHEWLDHAFSLELSSGRNDKYWRYGDGEDPHPHYSLYAENRATLLLVEAGTCASNTFGPRTSSGQRLRDTQRVLNDILFNKMYRENADITPRGLVWHQSLDFTEIMEYGVIQRHMRKTVVNLLKPKDMIEAVYKGLGFIINAGDTLIAVTRPHVFFDERGRIHNENGPAIVWGDGTESYYFGGVWIYKSWQESPATINVFGVVNDPNMERKRAMCQMIGWNRVLNAVGAREIQRDRYGILLETDAIRDDFEPNFWGGVSHWNPARFVKVKCPTKGDVYILRVPPNVNTAHEAVANSFGEFPSTYHPDIQS